MAFLVQTGWSYCAVVAIVTPIIGVSLEMMADRGLSAVSDISGEAVGKLVKKNYYRSRRHQRRSGGGCGMQTVMEFDNLHIAAVAWNFI